MKNIEVVSFDIDGTLIDIPIELTIESRKNTAERFFSDETLKEKINKESENTKKSFSKILKKYAENDNIKLILDQYNKNTLDLIKKYKDRIKTYDGIPELLKNLKDRGYELGIISNGLKALQYLKLNIAKIDKYFDDEKILISSDYSFSKPDKKIYIEFLKKFGLEKNPEKVLFIDDNRDNVLGAKKVGIKAYLSNWKNFITFNTPKDLKNYINFSKD